MAPADRPVPLVRTATGADLAAIRVVGIEAGELFRSVDDPRIAERADDPPFELDELAEALHTGAAWVAEVEGRVAGFLLAEELAGCSHVEEVSVRPEAQGRGLATALLDAAASWAGERGFGAVTLTTFRDVAWNRPFYERRGFRVLAEDELSEALVARRAAEAAAGLDPAIRVVMRRDPLTRTVFAEALPGVHLRFDRLPPATATVERMELTRRSFLKTAGGAGLGLAVAGSVTDLLSHPAGALTGSASVDGPGYGALVPDPAGLLDLPPGFRYKVFSRHLVDTLSLGQPVPGSHDGMAAFVAPGGGTYLIRNHEIEVADVGPELAPVPHRKGSTYDPSQAGGTTTIALTADNRVKWHRASLAGTIRNCAGGPTPWGTWLSCEENDSVVDGVKHGYVFEVDPVHDGNPRPIRAMGRFEHEAVAVNPRTGTVFLSEDASEPFGHIYRFRPTDARPGRGNLHKGGDLAAMKVPGVTQDLSEIDEVGTTVHGIRWVPIRNVDPAEGDTVRGSVAATPIQKAEGCWWAPGAFYFTSSYGYDAARPHQGQLWRYDFEASSLTLVAEFGIGSPFDGPDNVTISPWGGAFMCEDGDGDSHVVGLDRSGQPFAFAKNAGGDSEFAGACFAPNGKTFFVNIQDPGLTFAITGPFRI